MFLVKKDGDMLLSRKKQEEVAALLNEIWDAQETDVVITRSSECGILFSNKEAEGRLSPVVTDRKNCKAGYANCFPGLLRDFLGNVQIRWNKQ